ncbi:MAG: 30S ribosomal protein S12 methylthiotransferase RimO, partial [Gammaproteobacteria bacterium]
NVIREAHPDVLSITGPHQYEAVMKAVHDVLPRPHSPFLDLVPPQGIRLTPRHYAYLKISEGCNHRCSFCIIPQLRGDLVSRPAADVLREAEALAAAGVRELLVISQDTSAYGVDIRYEKSAWRDREVAARMTELCEALSELGILIRLHYVYPYPHVDEIMPLMQSGQVLPYLDVPFQHANERILKSMKRPAASVRTLERIATWRKLVPNIAIRSTFIVGFPGETDADFEELLEWLDEAQLDRVGCFEFEPVSGAPANHLPDAVPDEVKEERWHRLMARQQEISASRLQMKVGTTISVIVDEVGDGETIARSEGDAPEIDGKVLISNADAEVGDILTVEVERAGPYDLWGRAID